MSNVIYVYSYKTQRVFYVIKLRLNDQNYSLLLSRTRFRKSWDNITPQTIFAQKRTNRPFEYNYPGII